MEGLFTQLRIALHSQGQNAWPLSHRLQMSPGPSGSKPALELHRLGFQDPAVGSSSSTSDSDLSFAVGAQVPGPSACAAVKAARLCAEGLGQLLHAELTPRCVTGSPRRRGDLSHQMATGDWPSGAARGPGRIGDRRDRAGGRYIARRGPGTGIEQCRQVLRRPGDPRREGPWGVLGRGKTLIEVLGCSLCEGGGGQGRTRRSRSGCCSTSFR